MVQCECGTHPSSCCKCAERCRSLGTCIREACQSTLELARGCTSATNGTSIAFSRTSLSNQPFASRAATSGTQSPLQPSPAFTDTRCLHRHAARTCPTYLPSHIPTRGNDCIRYPSNAHACMHRGPAGSLGPIRSCVWIAVRVLAGPSCAYVAMFSSPLKARRVDTLRSTYTETWRAGTTVGWGICLAYLVP